MPLEVPTPMPAFRRLRTRPRTMISAGVLTVGAVAIAGAAWAYQGRPTTQVELNDGSVWVTKQADLMVGHFNHPSALLDGGLRAASDSYDIVQAGQHVLLHDESSGTVGVIDPATVKVRASAKLPGASDVEVGAATVAILDDGDGSLWVLPSSSVGSFKAASTTPQAKLGRGAAVAVGTDGTVYAVSPKRRELVTVHTTEQGVSDSVSRQSLSGVTPSSTVSVTAVGDEPVVLDSAHSSVVLPGGRTVQVDGADAGAALQQPGAANDGVLLETPDALVKVRLDDGRISRTAAGGTGEPAQPVYSQGCAYAVWSSSAQFVRDCVGTKDDLRAQVPQASSSAQLRFRVNRDVVVLNDVQDGGVWLTGSSLNKVDNWSDLTPPTSKTKQVDSNQTTPQTTLPKRTAQNHKPDAEDDEFGVRPGRTTVLPVLDNDSDPDGDVLTVTVKSPPKSGSVVPIDNGGAFQIAMPAAASGTDSFTYTACDGRGGCDDATVKLTVRPYSAANRGPVQKRVTTVQVESGASVSYNVLPDWIDPDGDDIYLAAAEALPGDQADFTPDGRLTYRSISGLTGKHDIKVTVSDGDKATTGILRLDIRPHGSTDPVANADHVVVPAGQTITVHPLENDISTGSDPLRLTRVADAAGADVVPDYSNSTFTFQSASAGTYYVQYEIASSGRPAAGIVRVDVTAGRQSDAPPVAVRDVALLPAGGEVLVDVLANDTDPAGGILVTQGVSVPQDAAATAAIVNHDDIRITDTGSGGVQQSQIRYTVSNGQKTAVGMISVIRVLPPQKLRAPVANDDTATVRVGDVVTIPVLQNDYSPTGSKLHVAPDLVEPLPQPADGQAFVSQDTVRFKAGDTAKTVHLTYTAIDADGQSDSAYITVQIVPMNVKDDSAPRPQDVTARTIAGTVQRIPIALDGIDPDGDSVELLGLASAPAKGRIVTVGQDYLDYEAFPDASGVDAFQYRVQDRLGRTGTAYIRVGIAAASTINHAPYAIKDAVTLRPGRSVAVSALANDSDPDGDTISLVRNGLTVPKVAGLDAVVSGSQVIVTAPGQEMTTQIQYTVRDSHGAESVGVIMVKVDRNVPLLAPIARDDVVLAQQVKRDARTVDVDVRANDDDPDGVRTDLSVALPNGGGTVLPGGKVRVALGERSQLVQYTVTDPDGLQASAFVHVPSLSELTPVLSTTTPVTVKSGQQVVIPLADHIVAAGGRSVRVTEASTVSAAHSDGSSLLKDAATLVYRSAAGYVGPDAVTLQVTDGSGPDDPSGRKATLQIPITVLPNGDLPPTFTSAQVDVAPGDTPAVLDLKPLTQDPDPGDLARMQYSISGEPGGGVSAKLNGSQLQVSAAPGARKGTQTQVALKITDGRTGPVAGTVQVTVRASTRPMPVAVEDDVTQAHQGDTITVPVLDNDFNPFSAEGKPLKLLSATAQNDQISASVSGDQVKVTLGDRYVGQATVGYRIEDATQDPDRQVDGKIVLTVQGKPDAPGTPAVDSVQSQTVVLHWSPPNDNGARITSYLVTSTKGDYRKTCEATTCTLDGLTNNVSYSFTVRAVNAVGTGPASAPSQSERPDASPDQPQPPTLKFGDSSLQVSWQTPSTPGSPVSSYNLQISPAPPSGVSQMTGVTGNSTVWKGLENGVAYQVQVQAVNKAPKPSSWSDWSASEVPAKAPDAPGAPTTQRLAPVGSQAQMQVSWNAPASNGDAISNYDLDVLQGSTVVRTIPVPGSQTSQAVTMDTSTTDYTFRVRAQNKAGWGANSPTSAPIRAFTAPGAPGTPTARATGANGTLAVTYSAPSDTNGADPSELRYQYSLNGGGWQGAWAGTSNTVTGLTNGQSYTVRVRAYSSIEGASYTGAASGSSNAAVPYGPPGSPNVSATASGTSITYRWSPPAPNGRAIVAAHVQIDGNQVSTATSGTITRDYGYSETHRIRVQVQDAAGDWSGWSGDSATTVAKPQPTAQAGKGASGSWSNCSTATCAYGTVTVHNFPAGTHYVTCNGTGPYGGTWGGKNYNFPQDGTVDLTCYYGGQAGVDQFWVTISGFGDSKKVTWY